LITYDDIFSGGVDKNDAVKLANFAENLSIKSHGQLLAVERKQFVDVADTIVLNMLQMKVKSYQFVFTSENFTNESVSAFLEDSYLNTSTPINLDGTTTFNFNVINVPGSWNPNRFRIVFKTATVLPITFSNIKAFQKNEDVDVEWKIENEMNIKQYEIERSSDGKRFVKVFAVTPQSNNNTTATYSWLDINSLEGNNFYRIRSVTMNGEIEYSSVVKVNMGKHGHGIVLITNLIVNDIINFNMVDMPYGIYEVRLLNIAGQVIFTKQIQHKEGTSTESIQVKNKTVKGLYILEVIQPDTKKIATKIILN